MIFRLNELNNSANLEGPGTTMWSHGRPSNILFMYTWLIVVKMLRVLNDVPCSRSALNHLLLKYFIKNSKLKFLSMMRTMHVGNRSLFRVSLFVINFGYVTRDSTFNWKQKIKFSLFWQLNKVSENLSEKKQWPDLDLYSPTEIFKINLLHSCSL